MEGMSVWSRPGINFAKYAVCTFYQITHEQLYSKSRKQPLPEARHIVWWFERKQGRKLTTIALDYNLKDHNAILSGIRNVNNLLSVDKQFLQRFETIKQQILS